MTSGLDGRSVIVTGASEQAVVDRVVETAVERFGGVDVLVNNAAIGSRASASADVDDAEWEQIIRVNLTAPFLLTRALRGGRADQVPRRDVPQPGHPHQRHRPGRHGDEDDPVVDENAHGPKALAPYRINVGRVSQPEEQAAAIVFLASDAASNVNGVILPVDNGWAAV